MPLITLNKSECPHQNTHPNWIGRNGISVAVCLLPRPYLENIVNLLEETINARYNDIPIDIVHIREDEYRLNILLAERKRRNYK